MSELLIVRDAAEVAERAAELFVEATAGAAAARDRALVALTGGSSASPLYVQLLSERWRARVPWDRVDLCTGDERAVPLDDPRSNAGVAQRELVGAGAGARTHWMTGAAPDLEPQAARFARELTGLFGPHPRFDLILLGLGPDGHVLSLFAGVASSADRGDDLLVRVVPAPLHLEPKLARITLTPAVLLRARLVVVQATGAAKASALFAMLRGPEDLVGCPAQWLRGASGRVVVLADEAAASRVADRSI